MVESMKVFREKTKIKNMNGFHVRPATQIAKEALTFKSLIYFYKNNENTPIDAKSSLDIIANYFAFDDEITIECKGEDAKDAILKIKELVEKEFDFPDAHPVPKF